MTDNIPPPENSLKQDDESPDIIINAKSDSGKEITPDDTPLTFLTPANFSNFSYSKKSHYKTFQRNDNDKLFYGTRIGPEGHDIKTYQNLLIFAFITENIPEGSRILEIGSGDDLIYNHFRYRYEMWRIEDETNLIYSKEAIEESKVQIIKDNNDKIQSKLPSDYFDFIFSTSAFEHVPAEKPIFKKVLNNILHVMKPGGYSMHCFSGVIVEKELFLYNRFLDYINNNITPVFYHVQRFMRFPVRTTVIADPDFHFIVEKFKKAAQYKYDEYLKTFSYNYLWRKNPIELTLNTSTKNYEYFKKRPAYIFHHLMKCGGTSLTFAFQEWFNLKLDHIKTEEVTVDLNQYLQFKYNLENLSSEDCIVSHFQSDGYLLHQRYPEVLKRKNEFKIFTFVREPLSIVISLYYYAKKRGELENVSLANSIKHSGNNFLASLFPCDENNYKEVLDRYFFIGIVEKMQESVDKLAILINKKKITVPVSNATDKDSQIAELKPEFIEAFKKINKLDYLVYNYCLEKFNKL